LAHHSVGMEPVLHAQPSLPLLASVFCRPASRELSRATGHYINAQRAEQTRQFG
jgi:hypothetical protein